ncbi:hypothetical protein U0070_011591, partial [Myodes glareolus]
FAHALWGAKHRAKTVDLKSHWSSTLEVQIRVHSLCPTAALQPSQQHRGTQESTAQQQHQRGVQHCPHASVGGWGGGRHGPRPSTGLLGPEGQGDPADAVLDMHPVTTTPTKLANLTKKAPVQKRRRSRSSSLAKGHCGLQNLAQVEGRKWAHHPLERNGLDRVAVNPSLYLLNFFYITYTNDPILYMYELLDDYKEGDLRILSEYNEIPPQDVDQKFVDGAPLEIVPGSIHPLEGRAESLALCCALSGASFPAVCEVTAENYLSSRG